MGWLDSFLVPMVYKPLRRGFLVLPTQALYITRESASSSSTR